jgi:hypothetical protein
MARTAEEEETKLVEEENVQRVFACFRSASFFYPPSLALACVFCRKAGWWSVRYGLTQLEATLLEHAGDGHFGALCLPQPLLAMLVHLLSSADFSSLHAATHRSIAAAVLDHSRLFRKCSSCLAESLQQSL